MTNDILSLTAFTPPPPPCPAHPSFCAGDPYQIFSFDFMHNWALGVLKLIVRGIKEYADSVQRPGTGVGYGTRALRILDQRLQQVPRIAGLRLPSCPTYFSEPANITASEHMAVAQVRRVLRARDWDAGRGRRGGVQPCSATAASSGLPKT